MSVNVIDSKVVEMKFDNSKFESNVKETMSTLDKLKLAISNLSGKKASIDIDTSETNKGILSLGNAADTVASKFNALEAVAFGALAKIGSQAVVAGEQLLKSLTVDQISAGWNKYDEKTSSVQTLVNSTGKSVEEINSYLDQLMWYSDETSYSFTEMTSALAQMTSTGGDIDKLIPTITGIANATAYAGKNGEAFVHTIRNLTQSYNAGYLQLMDWKSLNLAGTSSKQLTEQLIKAAEELGTVEKGFLTVENFAERLKDKNITTDVMDLAFSRFAEMSQEAYKLVKAGEFDTASEAIEAISDNFDELAQRAFKSAQEAKTFAEAIDATKDAVSSGWMNTFEIIFGNYEQAKELWTDLANGMWDFFAGGDEARNQKLSNILGDAWDNVTSRIEDCGIETEEFEYQLERMAATAGLNTEAIKEYYGSMGNWVQQTADENGHFIKDTIMNMAYATERVGEEFRITQKDLENYDKIVEKMASGKIKNATSALKEFSKAGLDQAGIQEMVNDYYSDGGKRVLDLKNNSDKLRQSMIDLSNSQVSSLGYTELQVQALRDLAAESRDSETDFAQVIDLMGQPSGRTLMIDALKDSLATLVDVINLVKDAFSDLFPEAQVTTVYDLIKKFRDLTGRMRAFVETEENAEKLTSTFKILASVLSIIKTVVGTGLNIVLGILNTIFESMGMHVLDFTASLGENLATFAKWLEKQKVAERVLEKITPTIKFLVEKIKEWTKEGGKLNKVFEYMKELLKDVKEGFLEWFEEFKKSDNKAEFLLGTLAEGFIQGIPFLAEKAEEAISTFFEYIKNYLNGTNADGTMSEAGEGALQAFMEGFNKGIEPFKDAIVDFGKDVIKKLKNLPWEQIFAVGLTIAMIKILHNISRWADAVQGILDPIGALINQAKKTMAAFQYTVKQIGKSLAKEATGDLLIKMAIAIGILALSIKLLSTIDMDIIWDRVAAIVVLMGTLVMAVAAIGVVIERIVAIDPIKSFAVMAGFILLINSLIAAMAVMMGIVFIASKIKNAAQGIGIFRTIVLALGILMAEVAFLAAATTGLDKQVKMMSLVIIAIAGAMLLCAMALKILSSIPEESIAKTWVMFVGISALLAIFVYLAQYAITSASIAAKQFGLAMLMVAGSFAIAAIALKILSTMDTDQIRKGIEFFTVFGIFVGIMAKITADKKYEDSIKDFAKMTIMISAAMLLTAIALKIIASLKIGELAKGIIFMGAFLGFVWLLGKIASEAKEQVKNFALTMLGLGGALVLMAIAVKILGEMDPGKIAKGLIAVGFLSAFLAGLVFVTRYTNSTAKIAATLLAAAFCIGIMAVIVFLLGQLKVETLAKGLAAVGLLTIFVGALIAVTKFANTESAMKTMIGIAILLATMAGALAIVSLIPSEKLKPTVKALIALMTTIGILITVIELIGHGLTKDGPIMKIIAVMAAILLEIAIILYILASVPNPLGVLESAIGISFVLLAMGAALAILSTLKTGISKDAMLMLAAMGAIVLEIGLILGSLNKLGMEAGIKQAIALGLLLDAMSVALWVAAQAGKAGTKAVAIGTTALLILVGGIGAIVLALAKIGEGVIATYTILLPAFAASLSVFFTTISGFLNTLKDDNMQKAVDGMSKLSQALFIITEAALLDRINNFLGVDLQAFANKITNFSGPLMAFVDDIKLLNKDDVEKANIACEVLTKLADFAEKLPKTGGLKGSILGDSDFGTFIQNVAELGPALVKFGANVKGLNKKEMENAIDAAKLLSELANSLPKYGGVMAEWFGNQMQLDTFASQFEAFGKGIAAFSKAVSPSGSNPGVNKEFMKKGTDAGENLAKLANSLPSLSGTIKQWFDGGTLDMGTFADQIEKFGEALWRFSNKCASLSEENLNKGLAASERLAAIAVSLSGVDAGNFFNQVQTLGSMGDDLESLGLGLARFNDAVAGTSYLTLSQTIPVIEKMAQALLVINGFNSDNVIAFTQGLSLLANADFQKVASGVQQFNNTGKGLNEEAFNRFMRCALQVIEIYERLGDITIKGGEIADLSYVGMQMLGLVSYIPEIMQNIEGVDLELLSSTFTTISGLAAILRGINTSEYENIGNAIMAMNQLKELDLNGIIAALTVDEGIGTIDEGTSAFITNLVTGIINGIDLVNEALNTLMDTIAETLKDRFIEVQGLGYLMMAGETEDGSLLLGFRMSKEHIINQLKYHIFEEIINEGIRSKYLEFYEAGYYLMEGLALGIEEGGQLAIAAAAEMAIQCAMATKNALSEESPSKLSYKFGMYWDQGLAYGIRDYASEVVDSATQLADMGIESLGRSIEDIYDVIDWDMNPVITPRLDLSYIEAETSALDKMLNSKSIPVEGELQNGEEMSTGNVYNTFTQNNYSPKALSRYEIYRQTKNQLSQIKGAMR
ncbi:MAG: hypothetical protein J6Y02_16530 [Pseudobutyrivibrio sp.]|nr:hypothetical protein [Pseudobutyrivibrio sp.]